MSGPMNGGIAPSSVAIPTSHGSSMRRRASLKTQYTVAAQKTTASTSARLRPTSHVLESKKLSAATIIREAACRGYTRRQTRFPGLPARRPARTRARRTAPASSSSSRRLEVDEEVERARHEHRLTERVCELERGARIVAGLDDVEPLPRAPRELLRRERARIRRARRDEPPSHAGERPKHRVHVLVGENRRHHRVVPRREMLDEPPDAVGPPVSTTTSPAAAARASGSHSGSPRTTAQPGWITASFSAAIASRVDPSTSVCSSDTFVRTTTRVPSSTFVASCRPPSPASTAAASTPPARKATKAAAVSASNWVASRRSAAGRTLASAASRSASAPSTRIRSAHDLTCGERYAPTRRPVAPRSSSTLRVVVDLPFVPTTCTAGRPACGSPSAARSARIRSSPKPSRGHGESASNQATCVMWLGAEQVELAPVPLELRALRLDHIGRRVRDEPLVGEHPLGPRDLLHEARALGLDVPCRLPALGPDDGREDAPLLVRAELDLDTAATEDLRSLLHAIEGVGLAGIRRIRLRPGRDDQPCVPGGQVRPDLLRHVRHERVEQREQRLERGQRRRAAVLVAVVETRLDRLGVPVAEVV